jgi:uncharacterized membrane protein YjgN (DUF898 family)
MTQQQSVQTQQCIEFNGNGKEFFKIYMVDFFLKLITLGIYSAWAKVRQTQYFYGNTYINQASFEYHANPIAILKARIIIVLGIFFYYLMITFYPIVDYFFYLVLLLIISFAVVLSVRFTMNNSSYKNIRFGFTGNFTESFKVFFLYGVLSIITLGLLIPLWEYKRFMFLVNHKTFGTKHLRFEGKVSYFFSVYMKFVLLVLLGIALTFVFAMTVVSPLVALWIDPSLNPATKVSPAVLITLLSVVLFYTVYMYFAYTYVYVRFQNYMYNNTSLDTVGFSSSLQARKLLWIKVSNFIFTLLTLGLYVPFAKIRIAQYKLSCITLYSSSWQDFEANNINNDKALFEEGGDILDMDLGF